MKTSSSLFCVSLSGLNEKAPFVRAVGLLRARDLPVLEEKHNSLTFASLLSYLEGLPCDDRRWFSEVEPMFEEFPAKERPAGFPRLRASRPTGACAWRQTLHPWLGNRLVCACVAACCLLIKARACANDDGFRVMFSDTTGVFRVFPALRTFAENKNSIEIGQKKQKKSPIF